MIYLNKEQMLPANKIKEISNSIHSWNSDSSSHNIIPPSFLWIIFCIYLVLGLLGVLVYFNL